MTLAGIGLGALLLALVLLTLRLPVALALAGAAVPGLVLIHAGGFHPGAAPNAAAEIMAELTALAQNPDLALTPLVLALGNLAFYSGFATRLYDAAAVWLRGMPGGMAIAAVLGCGGFSAMSGSSVACASTMGRICVPEMLRQGYDPRLAAASVAVGGTLGALIPPSMLFVLFGLMTATPVAQLFLAGLLPGLLSLAGMVLVIGWWVAGDRSAAPPAQDPATVSRAEALLAAWPVALLFAVIAGGLASGMLSAVAAMGLSVLLTMGIGLAQHRLTAECLLKALRETALQSGAILLIAAAATLFLGLMALSGAADVVTGWVAGAGLPFGVLMLLVVLVCVAMGMVMDPIAILILTLPFLMPLAEGYGLGPVWLAVILVKLIEIGLITPPIGLNVFVVGNVVRGVGMPQIFAGVARFLFVDLLVLALLILFPALALLIPGAAG